MILTIKKSANMTNNSINWSFYISDQEFRPDFRLSRKLTSTTQESDDGIFYTYSQPVHFARGYTKVKVDFGGGWKIENYLDPAEEIKRRVDLVNAAFAEAAKLEQTWSVHL